MTISNCSAYVQHIRKYLPELLSLISELWSSFTLPAANRSVHGSPVSKASFKCMLSSYKLSITIVASFPIDTVQLICLVYDLRFCT